jgi:hypothetical protein
MAIWAGIVSHAATNPAQIARWNDPRRTLDEDAEVVVRISPI